MTDEHFRVGVQHGLEDAPLYCWQDPCHQERYDAGYAVGQFQRMVQQHVERPRVRWDEFEAMMQRRGLVRD